jgi:hypothetical protein
MSAHYQPQRRTHVDRRVMPGDPRPGPTPAVGAGGNRAAPPPGAAPPHASDPACAFRPAAGEEVVDVEYIIREKPKTALVREFFSVQARCLSDKNSGEASYL